MSDPSEIALTVLMLSLSAKGAAAFWLVLPVSVLMIALAWRIARRR